jgi:hypothetical protein
MGPVGETEPQHHRLRVTIELPSDEPAEEEEAGGGEEDDQQLLAPADGFFDFYFKIILILYLIKFYLFYFIF